MTDQLNDARAELRQDESLLNSYTQLPVEGPTDARIVQARGQIFKNFNNNNDRVYRFMNVLGGNDNIDLFDEQNSEMMANRVISLLQIGRQRIILYRLRASLFSRLTNDANPDNAAEAFDRIAFCEGEVEATKNLLRRYLGPLMNPPSPNDELGIAPVLRAWHQIQFHAQREDLEEYMQEELELKMPGKVVMVRNLSHNHYMEASRGPCPRNVNSSLNPAYNTGGRWCPWLETTPLSAGQDTRSNKLFRVYGNSGGFTLWNIAWQ